MMDWLLVYDTKLATDNTGFETHNTYSSKYFITYLWVEHVCAPYIFIYFHYFIHSTFSIFLISETNQLA